MEPFGATPPSRLCTSEETPPVKAIRVRSVCPNAVGSRVAMGGGPGCPGWGRRRVRPGPGGPAVMVPELVTVAVVLTNIPKLCAPAVMEPKLVTLAVAVEATMALLFAPTVMEPKLVTLAV